MWYVFLPEGRSRIVCIFACLFFCFLFYFLLLFFFAQGDRIDPVVLERCEMAHFNGIEKL